jgi:hypothetical protein
LDRQVFRGSLPNRTRPYGLQNNLGAHRIPCKDFAAHSRRVSARREAASLGSARPRGRGGRYLNATDLRPEDVARQSAAGARIPSGLGCGRRSVDPSTSFPVNLRRATKRLPIR